MCLLQIFMRQTLSTLWKSFSIEKRPNVCWLGLEKVIFKSVLFVSPNLKLHNHKAIKTKVALKSQTSSIVPSNLDPWPRLWGWTTSLFHNRDFSWAPSCPPTDFRKPHSLKKAHPPRNIQLWKMGRVDQHLKLENNQIIYIQILLWFNPKSNQMSLKFSIKVQNHQNCIKIIDQFQFRGCWIDILLGYKVFR